MKMTGAPLIVAREERGKLDNSILVSELNSTQHLIVHVVFVVNIPIHK
jgi:hypothetical protein